MSYGYFYNPNAEQRIKRRVADGIVKCFSRLCMSNHRQGNWHPDRLAVVIHFHFLVRTRKRNQRSRPRHGTPPLRVSTAAGLGELAALRQPQALIAAVCDARARDEGANGIACGAIDSIWSACIRY